MSTKDPLVEADAPLCRTPATQQRLVDRRSLLTGGLGALAAGGSVGLAAGEPPRVRPRHAQRPRVVGPSRNPRTKYDPLILKLLKRATFGFSGETYDQAAALGYEGFLEWQLGHLSIDDSELDARLAPYDTLTMTSEQIVATYPNMAGVPVGQLTEAAILRAVYSKRQLFERMVEFWTDHFNIDILDGVCKYLKTADDRDVIRQYAMTSFPELLNASAHSAAMLFYLDNYTNVVGHAQENYARELMELHTLGVDGGYTQADVEEVARCLTGWTFAGPNHPTLDYGTFLFLPGQHDNGAKVVLGTNIPSGGGVNDGLTVLSLLANHPNTAGFISRKLCVRFLGYDPPDDIVETVKDTYLATGGDIKEMLRVILQQPVLTYLSTPKFKRPFHLAVSMLRAADAELTSARFVGAEIQIMGQLPFYWSPPDGYPDKLESWATSVLPRWDFASLFFDSQIPGALVNPTALLNSEGGSAPGEQAAAVDRILTGGALSDDEVTAMQDFYDTAPPPTGSVVRDLFGLGASMPGFQWY